MVIVTFKLFEFAKHLRTMSISVVCFYTDLPILDQADNNSHNKANTKMSLVWCRRTQCWISKIIVNFT